MPVLRSLIYLYATYAFIQQFALFLHSDNVGNQKHSFKARHESCLWGIHSHRNFTQQWIIVRTNAECIEWYKVSERVMCYGMCLEATRHAVEGKSFFNSDFCVTSEILALSPSSQVGKMNRITVLLDRALRASGEVMNVKNRAKCLSRNAWQALFLLRKVLLAYPYACSLI